MEIPIIFLGLAFIAASVGVLRVAVLDFRLFGAGLASISGVFGISVLALGAFLTFGQFIWPQPA